MSKVTLKHPDGPASFSHGGESFISDDEGFIDIPAHLTGEAKCHGFVDAERGPKKVLAKAADGAAEDAGEEADKSAKKKK